MRRNEPISILGTIEKGGNSHRIVPELMMGAKSDSFLSHLDLKIVKLNRKGKISLGIGTVGIVSHFCYKIYKKQL